MMAFFSWLAYLAWHHPDLASVVLAVGLALYGWRISWRLLPIPAATRARWAREQQVAEGCPACQYRGFLWFGIGLLGAQWWRREISANPESYDLIAPSIFITIGAISYVICRRFIRHAQARHP